jgi:hypothetical protein
MYRYGDMSNSGFGSIAIPFAPAAKAGRPEPTAKAAEPIEQFRRNVLRVWSIVFSKPGFTDIDATNRGPIVKSIHFRRLLRIFDVESSGAGPRILFILSTARATFAVVELYPNRFEVIGFGREPSRTLRIG